MLTPLVCSDVVVTVACVLVLLALGAALDGAGLSVGRFCSMILGELTKGIAAVSFGLDVRIPDRSVDLAKLDSIPAGELAEALKPAISKGRIDGLALLKT